MNFNNGKFYGSYIGEYAFSRCQNLLKIAFDYNKLTSNTLRKIQQGAFYGTSLNEIIIEKCPSNITSTELDKINPKYAQAMREIIEEMDIHKRSYGRNYNEWLVSKPKIQGVFLESDKYSYTNPPEFLAKYAEDNDLPIIYFGK